MSAEESKDEALRPLGERLGKFVILSELGRGAMGVVYEAFQEDLKRKVALKVLPANIALDAKQVRRFKREAESAAKLHHDNIVPIFEVGEIDDTHYFTMAVIDGRSFGEGRSRDREAVREAARIVRDAARGLAHAHENHVIHRDIKPSNLLLDRSGRVYVTDFGLARLTESASLTSTDAIVGTPKYMSPEQILARPEGLDGRADVYSLGATLYEVIAGRPPIEAPTVQAFIAAVLEQRPPNPRRFNREIPHDLATIVLRCLEKSPDDRYAAMRDLADDLDRFLAGERIVARPKRLVARAFETVRRHKVMAALAALSLVATTAVLVLSGSQRIQRLVAEVREEKDLDVAVEKAERLKADYPRRAEVEQAVRGAYARRAAASLASDDAPADQTLRDLERAGEAGSFWGLVLLAETQRIDEARAAAAALPENDPTRRLLLALCDVAERQYGRAIERLGPLGDDAHPMAHLALGEARLGLAVAAQSAVPPETMAAERHLKDGERALLDASRLAVKGPERWLVARIQVALSEVRTRMGVSSGLGELTTILGGVAQEALRNLTGFWSRMTKRETDVAREFVTSTLAAAGERTETLPAALELHAKERLRSAADPAEIVKANLVLAVANMSVGLLPAAAAALDDAEGVPSAPDAMLPYVHWGRSLLRRAQDDLTAAVRTALIALDHAAVAEGFQHEKALFRSALVLWDEAARRNAVDPAVAEAASYLAGWLRGREGGADAPADLLARLSAASPRVPPR